MTRQSRVQKSTGSETGLTIVVSSGGSGGHVTPILSVAKEIKRLQPRAQIIYIGLHGDQLGDVVNGEAIDEAHFITAGKFRRYHGVGFRQLLDIKTLLLNIRDFFRMLLGVYQSWLLLGVIKPTVIFTRGGFVSVPVGLAAGWREIPYITHDSDGIPSLANRIIADKASVHAVSMPKQTYPYPQDKTVQVGVPVSKDYKPVTEKLKAKYRRELGMDKGAKVLFVTGGGLGAIRLNDAVLQMSKRLFAAVPKLYILHIVGRANEESVKESYKKVLSKSELSRVRIVGYATDLYRYSGAADAIITRAGATALAEYAIQKPACIIVPNPLLTEGHQLYNVAVYEKAKAALVVKESPQLAGDLLVQAKKLLGDKQLQQQLGRNIGKLAQPDAAKKTAKLVLEVAAKSGEG